jgi:toxin FitB
MSWLLDADVLSQPAKKNGDPRVVAWLETVRNECYTSSIVVAQLAYWVRTKSGKERDALQDWLRRFLSAFDGRIRGFTVAVAHVWADQQRALEDAGVKMPIEDSYIAATARRHNLIIATGNERHFTRPGIRVFNPFRELD